MDPFILLHVDKVEAKDGDPLMSVVIFEWRDEELIGRYPPNGDAKVGNRRSSDKANLLRALLI